MEGLKANPLFTAGVTVGCLDPRAAAAWSEAVHQSLREVRGRVDGPVTAPGPGTNYYLARVRLEDGRPLRLMLNLAIGLVALICLDRFMAGCRGRAGVQP